MAQFFRDRLLRLLKFNAQKTNSHLIPGLPTGMDDPGSHLALKSDLSLIRLKDEGQGSLVRRYDINQGDQGRLEG